MNRSAAARLALALSLAAAAPSAARAVTIELTTGPTLAALEGTDKPLFDSVVSAAAAAAKMWEGALGDPITVKLKIDLSGGLPASVLGFFDVDAPGVTSPFSYMAVKAALAADVSGAPDVAAVAHFQPTPFVDMITNDTTAFGAERLRIGGVPSKTYNTMLRLPRAQQKALGLLSPADGAPGADGTLVINAVSLTSFDFVQAGGIDPAKIDATGVFAHEFGHALGFLSGVDHIDYAANPIGFPAPGHPDDFSDDAIFTVLDLFRFSTDSLSKPMQPLPGHVNDWAFGSFPPGVPAATPYFSIDGGATPMGMWSTGAIFGDGFQAQHWKDVKFPGIAFGLMDPDVAKGELAVVKSLDKLAMDVIGYNIVPEPTAATLIFAAALAAADRRRRRRRA
jgi:hypothetical protein